MYVRCALRVCWQRSRGETTSHREKKQIETDTQKMFVYISLYMSMGIEHSGIQAFCGYVPILYTIFNWWRERKKKWEKFDEKEWKKKEVTRTNDCAALFFDMMLLMPKSIGRTSWLPRCLCVCARPCSIVTCYMNRIRAWSERMERKKQKKNSSFHFVLMSCVQWWWVCRALDVHTGYMWTLPNMYKIGEEEKKMSKD